MEDVAFVGGFIEFENWRGVIVAFDVSDPESITTDSSSLRPLYRLDFETTVVDIAVQGSFMYVLQGPSRLNVLDLTVSPPELRASHVVGGGVARLDVQEDLLAVTDAALVNKTVRFYRLSGTEITLESEAVLPGQPIDVTLEGDRAYVSWHPDDNFLRGLAVFDIADARSPQLLYSLSDGALGGNHHLVRRGTVYLLGDSDMAIVRQVWVSSIVADTWPRTLFLAVVVAAASVFVVERVLHGLRSRRAAAGQPEPRPGGKS